MSTDRLVPLPTAATPARVRWSSTDLTLDWQHTAITHHHPVDSRDVAHAVADELRMAASTPARHDPAAGHHRPVVLGALPFDSQGSDPLLLVRPVSAESLAATHKADTDTDADAASTRHDLHAAARFVGSTPSEAEYVEGVRRLQEIIASGEAEKVVLARRFDYDLGAPVDVDEVFDRLGEQHPGALRFGVPVPGGRFLGASPELLVSRRGTTVRSHPLAGSARRSSDLREDEAAARALLRSGKDLREHAFVVEAIADTLAPYCRRLVVPAEPSLVGTRTTWHLGTWIEGELRDLDTSCAELAAALHPTPAVCGTSTETARSLIAGLESGRGYYAGAVGWADGAGDGEWAVAIRSALVTDQRLSAYAGAGIVADSDPMAELAETEAKVRAVLGAFTVADSDVTSLVGGADLAELTA